MIIHSYDTDSPAVMERSDVLKRSDVTLEICIINFSYKIMDALIEDGLIEEVDVEPLIKSVSCAYPVYRYRGTNIGVVKTTVGAPIAAGLIEEIGYVYSCKRFVIFGSAGGLDKTISPGALIVPTHAYRDEGMSYHYAPPADYIDIRNHSAVSSVLDSLGIEYVKGRTWSTDAFYRETRSNMAARVSEGCIAVEMELAACQAVADFRDAQLYSFLYRADNLDSTHWERSILSDISIDERLKHFFIAFHIAKRIIEEY